MQITSKNEYYTTSNCETFSVNCSEEFSLCAAFGMEAEQRITTDFLTVLFYLVLSLSAVLSEIRQKLLKHILSRVYKMLCSAVKMPIFINSQRSRKKGHLFFPKMLSLKFLIVFQFSFKYRCLSSATSVKTFNQP